MNDYFNILLLNLHVKCQFAGCVGVFEEIHNKSYRNGEVRSDAKSVEECKRACMEYSDNCAAVDFSKGVCKIYHKDMNDHHKLTNAKGNVHYYVVPC